MNEESIFLEALGMTDPHERVRFLERACAGNAARRERIEKLLAAHPEAGNFLERPSGPLGKTLGATAAGAEQPGMMLAGRYKLLEAIGEGGMGSVWVAQQTEPVKRLVAVKLIKAGMDSRAVLARFEAERQALALMDHPNIAKVHDAGTTPDGRPFFVMELVKGLPITRFCDEQRLTPRQRLELFVPVCQAIQHAHQKGIIHRDIKPSNVLVALYDDRPVVKVIDFGVAKATGQQLTERTLHTGFGAVVGTVEYMSPEQANFNQFDVDTRSDVYSLGVLLYELLTGSPPFSRKELEKAGLLEVLRLIREQEPSRPSTKLSTAEGLPTLAANRGTEPAKLTRLVRGELDWIVMKALEKDRSRRYETANGFAADVQRYLADEPVQACPPSVGYRLRKLVRRNKGTAIAATLVVLALVCGMIGTTVGMWRASEAEADALDQAKQKERQRAKAVEESERARRAEHSGRQRLFEAKKAEAKASRRSGQPGQRLDTWKALTEAADLARELKMEPEVFLTLRNEAIACLALTDLRPIITWQGYPPGSVGKPGFDADLRHYARSDAKGNISVRSVDDDRELALLPSPGPFAPGRGASVILFSPKGDLLAVRYDQQIPGRSTDFLLWDWRHQKVVFQPSFPVANELAGFSPDGRLLVLGQADGTITLHEASTGKERSRISVAPGSRFLAFSPDGARLATCSQGQVQVRELGNGKLTATLPHPAWVKRLAWHPKGVLLSASCEDGNVYLWDAVTGRQNDVLRGHQSAVERVAFAPSGDMLVSSSWDCTCRFWNPYGGDVLLRMPAGGDVFAFNSDGSRIVCSNGPTYTLWEVNLADECRMLTRSQGFDKERVNNVDFSLDGRWLAVTTSQGIRIHDMRLRKEVAFVPLSASMNGVRFHPKGKQLFTSNDSGVYTWPLEELDGVLRIGAAGKLHASGAHHLSLDREGRVLAGIANGPGWILDLEDGAAKLREIRHNAAAFSATSPDGRWVATGAWHGSGVKIWETATGRELIHLLPEEPRAWPEFSPDGRLLVTGFPTGGAIWATPQGEDPPDASASWKLQRKFFTDSTYGKAAFRSDSKFLAIPQSLRVVDLLDPTSGQTYAKLTAPDSQAWTLVRLSPDNTQLVMKMEFGPAVFVWDLGKVREKLKEIGLDWDM